MTVGNLASAHVQPADLEEELAETRAELRRLRGWPLVVDPEMFRVRLLEVAAHEATLLAELNRRALITDEGRRS